MYVCTFIQYVQDINTPNLYDKALQEVSKFYISRYYCTCDGTFGELDSMNKKKKSLSQRWKKFLKSSGYCTCKSNND